MLTILTINPYFLPFTLKNQIKWLVGLAINSKNTNGDITFLYILDLSP